MKRIPEENNVQKLLVIESLNYLDAFAPLLIHFSTIIRSFRPNHEIDKQERLLGI